MNLFKAFLNAVLFLAILLIMVGTLSLIFITDNPWIFIGIPILVILSLLTISFYGE